jgi:hypothetical protein
MTNYAITQAKRIASLTKSHDQKRITLEEFEVGVYLVALEIVGAISDSAAGLEYRERVENAISEVTG